MLSAREGQTYLSEILLGADEDLFILGEIMSMNPEKKGIWNNVFFYCFVLHKKKLLLKANYVHPNIGGWVS